MPLARAWIGGLLGYEHPARDAVRQLVTELVTNAVRHSRSGEPGGRVYITAVVSGDRVHVAVRDQGSQSVPTVRRPSPCSTDGRGLMLVDRLADDWGSRDTENGEHVVWFVTGAGEG